MSRTICVLFQVCLLPTLFQCVFQPPLYMNLVAACPPQATAVLKTCHCMLSGRCGGLHVNSPHRLICLKACLTVGETVREGGMVVVIRDRVEASSVLSACSLQFGMWVFSCCFLPYLPACAVHHGGDEFLCPWICKLQVKPFFYRLPRLCVLPQQ